MKRYLGTILWAATALVIGFFILDFPYFQFQISRALHKQQSAGITAGGERAILTPNRVVIPSLNIDALIIYDNATSSDAFEADLQKGVVHYPGTALPGQAGNCYIFGHSSDYVWVHGNYKTVFAALPEIKTGAEIKITDMYGKQYSYAVTKSFVAAADDVALLKQDSGQHLLTLQTSYPLGTALKRFIVQAELKN